jgi:uncharacterized protein YndB with AHSA1/START domain
MADDRDTTSDSDSDSSGGDMVRDVVTVERIIPAEPAAIFDLLADPSRHHDFDGSGTVREARTGSERLALGSTFKMSMKMGIPYSMVSTVTEFDENRLIAWQTRGPGAIGRHVAGRIWRYELEPVDGGTRVRESWDIRHEAAVTRPLVRRGAKQTRTNMTATLEHIESLVI